MTREEFAKLSPEEAVAEYVRAGAAATQRESRLLCALNSTLEQFKKVTQIVCGLGRHVRELDSLATIDPLTGLYNRREASILFQNTCEGAKREGKLVAVMMLDLDYFKSINDTYGHPVGDVVLKETVKTIKENSRPTDQAVRWGGEEFCLFYMCRSSDTGSVHAERLRSSVEAMDLTAEGCPKVVTASIGVHFLDPTQLERSCNLESELEVADKLLYHSKKKGGRNCISVLSVNGDVEVISRGQEPTPANADNVSEIPKRRALAAIGCVFCRLLARVAR